MAHASFGRTLGRAIGRFILGTILMAAIVLGGSAVRVWQFARTDNTSPADAIVVMGAAQYNGTPSKWYAARLDHAAELYFDGVASTIVTLGGKQAGDAYTEGEAGRLYLEKLGVPDTSIIAVGQGIDTLSSAQAFSTVATSVGWKRAVLVTDPWHSFRARTMLRDASGMTITSSPTRHGPAVEARTSEISGIFHETAGLIYYKVTHRSSLVLKDVDTAIFSNQDEG